MKKTKSIITLFFLLTTCMLFAQDKCVEGDCENGKGVYQWADGDKYEGHFLNGEFDGEGTYYWASGKVHTGFWNMGRRHGKGRHTTADGIITTGTWNYGYIVKTSQNIEVAKNGDVKEEIYGIETPDSEVVEEEMLKTEKAEPTFISDKIGTFTEPTAMADVLVGPELIITNPKPTNDLITTEGTNLTIKGYASDPARVLSLWVNDRKVELENDGENHIEFEVEVELKGDGKEIVIKAINGKFNKSKKVYDVIFEPTKKN